MPTLGAQGGAAAAAAPTAAGDAKLEVDFSGRWIKDGQRSTPMTDALRVMQIGGIMRQAIKLVRGCNISQTDDEFVMDITSVIGWFKVRETYKLNGEVSSNRRRDFRRGGARGVARAAARDKLELKLEFDDPNGGVNVDEFTMPAPDELHIKTLLTTTAGEATEFTQVYRRAG
ncbi:hypothetical protein Rsub_12664 [Raphidocelis subcapitata]|uniref:Uncharacterized protein n=1 Tax=Raphidocelis subcapitata TaxID=307507 RepID=A0A2V0PJJ2_9CHLO|nr:hypothetical protein Rsub_12664 [Raphidocelis subcapitata]|eukprot:GBF99971.1 hypothetical protein Rsub_12664 [Raphidocelis subcapitata]